MRARVNEIFRSIQGEGIYQGIPQLFIRFFGCNLCCCYCDTQLDFYHEWSVDDVVKKIYFYKDYHSIVLTGGEPLCQADFARRLAQLLKKDGKTIYLETNGTLPFKLLEVSDFIDIIAMDFKLPSSTDERAFWSEHKEFLEIASSKKVFIKAVITQTTSVEDLLKAIDIIRQVKSDVVIALQPQNPFEDLLEYKMRSFKNICKDQGINAKIISQLHKKIGVK